MSFAAVVRLNRLGLFTTKTAKMDNQMNNRTNITQAIGK